MNDYSLQSDQEDAESSDSEESDFLNTSDESEDEDKVELVNVMEKPVSRPVPKESTEEEAMVVGKNFRLMLAIAAFKILHTTCIRFI